MLVIEYWSASTANGGPGKGSSTDTHGEWATIDIFSENNNGTLDRPKKIFFNELFEPTAFIAGGEVIIW